MASATPPPEKTANRRYTEKCLDEWEHLPRSGNPPPPDIVIARALLDLADATREQTAALQK
jgi:hypothetical protein